MKYKLVYLREGQNDCMREREERERERVDQELLVRTPYLQVAMHKKRVLIFSVFFFQKTDTGWVSQPRDLRPQLPTKMACRFFSDACRLQRIAGFENFDYYIFFWCPNISFWRFTYAFHVASPQSLICLKTQLHFLTFEIHINQPVKGQYVTYCLEYTLKVYVLKPSWSLLDHQDYCNKNEISLKISLLYCNQLVCPCCSGYSCCK